MHRKLILLMQQFIKTVKYTPKKSNVLTLCLLVDESPDLRKVFRYFVGQVNYKNKFMFGNDNACLSRAQLSHTIKFKAL